MINKKYINKNLFYEIILLQLLKDKKEKKEIINNLQDYINKNTIKKNVLQIKRLVHILEYDGYTIIDNPITNIEKFYYSYKKNNLLEEEVSINIK